MATLIEKTIQKLNKRAKALKALTNQKSHPSMVAPLKRAHAGLLMAAEKLGRLEGASLRYTDRTVRTAKVQQSKGVGAPEGRTKLALAALVFSFEQLLRSAELLANGRDVEVLKVLGERTLEVALKAGAILTHAETIKKAAELAELAKDALKAGESTQLRKDQVEAASDVLRWADAVCFVTLTWCYAAELFLLGTVGKGTTPPKKIIDHVMKQIDRAEKKW